jgi:HPt (histidine-containing phosphotransfer) domain-containing protein
MRLQGDFKKSITVEIEHDMADLIPLFMTQRKSDQIALAQALPLRDFDTVRRTGHGMAGAGASYGFDHVSSVGQRLEAAAIAQDVRLIEQLRQELADYMARVDVKFGGLWNLTYG